MKQRLRALASLRAPRRAFSARVDDEESVPEKLREDRALSIAQTQTKTDALLNEILNKEQTMSSLDNLYNVHQKQMSLLHHSFLLYRVNSVYKDIKKKPEGDDAAVHIISPESVASALHIGRSIYRQVCFHINRNVK